MATGRRAEALPYIERAVALWEGASGPEHLNLARPLLALAMVYVAGGRWGEAEAALTRALAIVENNAGSDHPLAGETLT